MKRHERARAWRKRRDLTIDQLAELTGYGRRSIIWLEKGLTPPGNNRSKPAPVADWVWQRWKMMCAGVEAQIRSGKKFDW